MSGNAYRTCDKCSKEIFIANMYTTKCGHVFCAPCIKRLNAKCFVCNNSIIPLKEFSLHGLVKPSPHDEIKHGIYGRYNNNIDISKNRHIDIFTGEYRDPDLDDRYEKCQDCNLEIATHINKSTDKKLHVCNDCDSARRRNEPPYVLELTLISSIRN